MSFCFISSPWLEGKWKLMGWNSCSNYAAVNWLGRLKCTCKWWMRRCHVSWPQFPKLLTRRAVPAAWHWPLKTCGDHWTGMTYVELATWNMYCIYAYHWRQRSAGCSRPSAYMSRPGTTAGPHWSAVKCCLACDLPIWHHESWHSMSAKLFINSTLLDSKWFPYVAYHSPKK